jgi:predicted PurR-regulated permease PerM
MAANVDIYLDRFEAHEKRISALEEHQRIMARRDAIQFVVALLVVIGSLFGASSFMSWQSAKLIEQIDKRIEQVEKSTNTHIDALEKNTNARIDALEKNTNARMEDLRQDLTARFEDLKQVVLSQRK